MSKETILKEIDRRALEAVTVLMSIKRNIFNRRVKTYARGKIAALCEFQSWIEENYKEGMNKIEVMKELKIKYTIIKTDSFSKNIQSEVDLEGEDLKDVILVLETTVRDLKMIKSNE